MTNTQRIESLENTVNLLINTLNASAQAQAQKANDAATPTGSVVKAKPATSKKSTTARKSTKKSTAKQSKELTWDVKRVVATLSESGQFRKKLTIMRWGEGEYKLDLRNWVTNSETGKDEPRKGITLTDEEAVALYEGLKKLVES